MANAQTIQLNLRAISDFSDVTGDIAQVQQMLGKLKLPAGMAKNFEGIFAELTRETTKYQKLLDTGFKKKGDVTGLEGSGKRITALLQRLQGEMGKINPSILKESFKVDPSMLDGLTRKMTELQGQLSGKLNSDAFVKMKKDVDSVTTSMQGLSKSKFTTNFAEAFKQGDIKGAAEALQQLEANHKQFTTTLADGTPKEQVFQQNLAKMQSLLAALAGDSDIQNIVSQIQQLDVQMDQLDADELQRFVQTFQQGQTSVDGMTREVREFTSQTNQAAQSQMSLNTQMDQLKSQLGYFFSLTNSVYILRSALQSAFETVKELDAVMTETAVVTDFSVGDMWKQLPEYAKAASNLGSSIQDVYAATTLYYQQGLKGNEVMRVGIETMKMARIAGMDAAEATQAMTAALRGFNMEVTEANSTRVNDVYSNLAAITASDTEQIATAMTKTASIAHSANMEFETTAALLAQIIETTQEAPETAGTAMKTIIARFSEVKELKEKGLSSGEDEEGELIDANKISAALSKIGISMNGFFQGTEGLDSVLLKLADKWDELDFTTQRYIATLAAGSRQQSRFIAMMSDYSRTTQLVTAANNSAGASTKQFDKTMESLDAKLNKLSVAWNQFTMGLADNTLIKAGIDLLTGILNVINKVLNVLPGVTKSFASLGVVFVALRLGGLLLNKALSGISAAMIKGVAEAKAAGEAAGHAATSGAASAVNSPVAAANLSRSYKLLFLKVQASVPPVTLRLREDAILEASVLEKKLADIRREKAKLNAESAEYIALEQKESEVIKKLNGQYVLEGAAFDKLSKEQQEVIANKLLDGTLTTEQVALMGPAVAARYADAVAAGDEATALAIKNKMAAQENALRAGGLKGFFTEIGLRVTNSQVVGVERVSIGKLIKTKLAEAVAWIKANAAMLAGIAIVAMYVAAIALLIAGIAKLVKAWQNNENATEKSIAKMNQTIEEFGNQAKEAKEQLNEMADQRSGLQELEDQLSSLTKGTTEWKNKLVEVNSQVLELITKYPELAAHVIHGTDGQLSIDDAGWVAMQEMLTNQYNYALTGSLGAQMVKSEKEEQLAIEKANAAKQARYDYNDKINSQEALAGGQLAGAGAGAIGGIALGAKLGAAGSVGGPVGALIGFVIGAVVGGIAGYFGTDLLGDAAKTDDEVTRSLTGVNRDDYVKFAIEAQKAGLSADYSSEEEFKALFQAMGFDEKGYDFEKLYINITSLRERFTELGVSASGLQTAQEVYTRSLVNQAAVISGVAYEDYGNQVVEIVTQKSLDSEEKIDKLASEMKDNKDYVTRKGEATDKLIEEYAKAANMEKDAVSEKIKDGGLSVDTMTTGVATNKVNQDILESLKDTSQIYNETVKRLNAQGKDVKLLTRVLSTEGKRMTQEDARWVEDAKKRVSGDGSFSDKNEADQKALVESFMQHYGATYSDFNLKEEDWKLIWNNLYSGSQQFADTAKLWEQLGVDLDGRFEGEGVTKLGEQIRAYVDTTGDAEQATDILNIINTIAGKLSDEDAAVFLTQLGELEWTNYDDVNYLSEALGGLGLNMVALGGDVATLENKIKNFAKSTKEADPDYLDTYFDLYSQIKYQGKTSFSEEEYTKYFKANYSDSFVKIGSTYYANGLDSNALAKIIKEEVEGSVVQVEGESEYESKLGHQGTAPADIYTYTANVPNSTFTSEGKTASMEMGAKTVENGGYLNSFFPMRVGYGYAENVVKNGIDINEYVDGSSVQKQSKDDFSAAYGTNLPYLMYFMNYGVNGTDQVNAEEVLTLFFKDEGKTLQDYGKLLYDWLEKATNDEKTAFYNAARAFMGEAYFKDGGSQAYNEASVDVYNGDEVDPISNEVESKYAWNKIKKDYFQRVLPDNPTGGTKVSGDNFWAQLEGLFGNDTTIFATDGPFTKDMENVVSEGSIETLYKQIYPHGGETDPGKQKTALEDYYNNIVTKSGKVKESSFWESLAPMEAYDIYTATQSAIPQKQEAAKSILTTQLSNEYGVALAEWMKKQGNGETDDYGYKALAIQVSEAAKGMETFNTAAKSSIEVLKKGKSAGFEYYQALDQLKVGFQAAFGTAPNYTTLELMIPYLDDLTKGGETAAAAYKKLSLEITKAIIKQKQLETSKGGRGWSNAAAADYTTAMTKLQQHDWNISPTLDLKKWYDSLKLTALSYDEFALAIKENPIYGSLNIGVTVDKDGKIVADSDTSDDIISTLDWGSWFSTTNEETDPAEPWENPYDKQYTLVQKINAELREREKLELRYQRLMKHSNASAADLVDNRKKQLDSLFEEKGMREDLLDKRLAEMDELQTDKYAEVSEYAYYDKDLGKVILNQDALAKLEGSTDSELTEKVEEYISALEEKEGQIEEEVDALEDIEDGVWEIYEQGKDEYFSFEDSIKEALVQEKQDEIDALTNINDSISEASSSMIQTLQDTINQYRQDRENEETEEDLADKQRQIAYLQQDTSGANAMEILKLQEELDKSVEDYTDTLIDQKITELQEQNDQAAEQRQRQIDILEEQLQNYQDTGAVWNDVYKVLDDSTDEDGKLMNGSKLMQIMKNKDNFAGMSQLGKMNWLNTLEGDLSSALSWLKLGAMQTMFKEGATVSFKDTDGNTVTGTVDKYGNVVTKEHGTLDGKMFSMDAEGNVTYGASLTKKEPKKEDKKEEGYVPAVNDYVKVTKGAVFYDGQTFNESVRKNGVIANKTGAFKVLTDEGKGYYYIGRSWTKGGVTGKIHKSYLTKYASGGLADFTGPAWLDGTKSKPEYVLNAKQTKAFLTLVDVLDSLKSVPAQSSTENHGDNIYDIDINVESIGNDYDVEQIASTIKNLINEDAQYRNNNAISLMR